MIVALTTASVVLAVPPGAAAEEASTAEAAPSLGFFFQGRLYTRIRPLRQRVERAGRDWNGFLRNQPAVVRAFDLYTLRWGGQRFFAQYALRRWLNARGATLQRWRAQFPGAAFRLSRNRYARFVPGPSPNGPGGAPGAPVLAPAPESPGFPVSERYGIAPDNLPYADPPTRDRILDSIAAAGAKWIRFDMSWALVQWPGPDVWHWSAYDALVPAARARGLKILGTLGYTPPWGRPPECPGQVQCAPRDLNEFARFVEAAVARYRAQIGHWEVWNEPNWAFWLPRPNPARYAELLRLLYPRIKAVDPTATIIGGATAPAPNQDGWIDEVTFLQRVYAAGGGGFFDAWSHHPYTHPHGPDFFHPDSAWTQMLGATPSIRSVMEANGDGGKALWATEYGSPTDGSPGAVSETMQAKHLRDAYTLWRSYPWAGPLFWYSARDVGNGSEGWRYSGLLRLDFSPKPAYATYQQVAAGN